MYVDSYVSVNTLLGWIEEELGSPVKEVSWEGYRNDLLYFKLEDEERLKGLITYNTRPYYNESGELRGKYTSWPDMSVKRLYEKRNQGCVVLQCMLSSTREVYSLRVRDPKKELFDTHPIRKSGQAE